MIALHSPYLHERTAQLEAEYMLQGGRTESLSAFYH